MPEILRLASKPTLNCFYFLSSYIPVVFFVVFVVLLFLTFTLLVGPLIRHSRLGIFAYILVLIGGGFNTFFRFVYGCVSDPIVFLGWVSFNFWDILVMVGLCMLGIVLYHSITLDISKGKNRNEP